MLTDYKLLLSTFALQNPEELKEFFPKEKTIEQRLAVTTKRVSHLVKTDIWIDRKALLRFTNYHQIKISPLVKGLPIERKVRRCEERMHIPNGSLIEKAKETALFISSFFREQSSVGSLCPSSDALAKAIVQIPKFSLTDNLEKRIILEVGPGTGSFTNKIIRRMGPNDVLHLVELDRGFCRVLEKKFHQLIADERVKVFNIPIQEHVGPKEKYDYIVSGLPLNAFKPDLVRAIFDKIEDLSKSNTKFTYFEYMYLTTVQQILKQGKDLKDFKEVLAEKNQFYQKHGVKKLEVYMNITPAYVVCHNIQ